MSVSKMAMLLTLVVVALISKSSSHECGNSDHIEDPFHPPTTCIRTAQVARDCEELQDSSPSVLTSGVYLIQPLTYTSPFNVYCDFKADGGGWTVIQRRVDGSVDFHLGWSDYKNGFGELQTDFWLGNEKISTITAQKNYQIRIELSANEGRSRYAKYSFFRVGREDIYYKLSIGSYSGNAGDSMDIHRNMYFTTYDADHDMHDTANCANTHKGGWWFNECDISNLNGDWTGQGHSGIEWTNHPDGGDYGLKFVEMKIRAV